MREAERIKLSLHFCSVPTPYCVCLFRASDATTPRAKLVPVNDNMLVR